MMNKRFVAVGYGVWDKWLLF